jgi:hypothetical protein
MAMAPRTAPDDPDAMVKRASISALWFFSFFCMSELAWSLAGSPRVLGVILGTAAAVFVAIDPLHLFFAAGPARMRRPAAAGGPQAVGQ